jgi:ADP-heptose:LPS heptosyltransferase
MLIPKHFYSENSYLKKDPGIKYIGMQLGAQDIYKMWPIDNFICLAEKICKEFSNIKFVMLGSTKYEQNLVKKFQLGFSGSDLIVNLCGNSSIKSLPKILNDLELVITNDTGTLHLAIALQIKTVSLFGPTDSRVFGPYQDLDIHKVIQKDGGFVNDLPKKQRSQEGMRLIKVDDVYCSIKDLL